MCRYRQQIGVNMKRTIIIFTILIIAVSCVIYKAIDKDKLVVAYYETYTVQTNDSLWSISKQYNYGEDIRKFIYIIKDNNNVSANLQIGQELLIPILEVE